MRLDAGVLRVIKGTDRQVVLEIPKDRFHLAELNLELPPQGWIFPAQIRAQQIMTFPAQGLPKFVLAQGQAESFRVDRLLGPRHANLHQAIGAARSSGKSTPCRPSPRGASKTSMPRHHAAFWLSLISPRYSTCRCTTRRDEARRFSTMLQ